MKDVITILIVNDDPFQANVLFSLLTKKVEALLPSDDSCKVLTFKAVNGHEALDVIKKRILQQHSLRSECAFEGFPVIISDIQMPIMNGFDLCCKVRELYQ